MNIVATQYNLEHRALEIYVSGCTLHCKNCHNPELQNFDTGTPYETWIDKLDRKMIDFADIIDNIWILGGEPLDQDVWNLKDLLYNMSLHGKKIWIFTGYNYNRAAERGSINMWALVNYLKYGAYKDDDLTDDNIQFGVKLASGNQGIKELK